MINLFCYAHMLRLHILIALPWKRREKSVFVRHFFVICDPKSFVMSYFLVPLLGQMNPLPYETYFFPSFVLIFSYFTFFSSAISSLFGFGYVSWPMCVIKDRIGCGAALVYGSIFFSLFLVFSANPAFCVSLTHQHHRHHQSWRFVLEAGCSS